MLVSFRRFTHKFCGGVNLMCLSGGNLYLCISYQLQIKSMMIILQFVNSEGCHCTRHSTILKYSRLLCNSAQHNLKHPFSIGLSWQMIGSIDIIHVFDPKALSPKSIHDFCLKLCITLRHDSINIYNSGFSYRSHMMESVLKTVNTFPHVWCGFVKQLFSSTSMAKVKVAPTGMESRLPQWMLASPSTLAELELLWAEHSESLGPSF